MEGVADLVAKARQETNNGLGSAAARHVEDFHRLVVNRDDFKEVALIGGTERLKIKLRSCLSVQAPVRERPVKDFPLALT